MKSTLYYYRITRYCEVHPSQVQVDQDRSTQGGRHQTGRNGGRMDRGGGTAVLSRHLTSCVPVHHLPHHARHHNQSEGRRREPGEAEHKFLAGDFFSFADLNHFPFTFYFMDTPYASVFDAYPRVKGWWESLMSRPSIKMITANMPTKF
jgi:hypothetical protein